MLKGIEVRFLKTMDIIGKPLFDQKKKDLMDAGFVIDARFAEAFNYGIIDIFEVVEKKEG